jgi:hypothetical protein
MAYSFLTIHAAITGPGGAFPLSGVGNAEEGISIEPTGDKNVMTVGADGEVMHSLKADKSGTVTVRLLRTSPANAALKVMYVAQTASPMLHGKNTIVITNRASGDIITCRQCAFAKDISNGYAAEGGTIEWVFHAGKIDGLLGLYDLDG